MRDRRNDHWNDVDRETRRGAPRIFLIAVLSVLGVLLLIGAVVGVKYVTAEPRGAADQREKTVANGNYRIASYDAYFDQCRAVRAADLKADRAAEAVRGANSPDEKRRAQINLDALLNNRIEMAEAYNANAGKEDTMAMFKADNLPTEITEETPTCQ